MPKLTRPIKQREPEGRCHGVDDNDSHDSFPCVVFPKTSCKMTLSKFGFSPLFRMIGNSKLFSPVKYDFVLLLNRCGLGKHLLFPSGRM